MFGHKLKKYVYYSDQMKWIDSGFRPPLCTYKLNWARRTSWGWWHDWGDTVLPTQDSKFEPWRSEAEHATSRSRRLPTILNLTRGWGRNIFCFFQTAEPGNRTPNSGVKGSGANHYPRAPAHYRGQQLQVCEKWVNTTLDENSDRHFLWVGVENLVPQISDFFAWLITHYTGTDSIYQRRWPGIEAHQTSDNAHRCENKNATSICSIPSKHVTLKQCCLNIGPASKTLA